MKIRTSCPAFTLVELLMVMTIMALLILILLPALNKANVISQRVTCAARLKQLMAITIIYANDNHGFLPDLHNSTGMYLAAADYRTPVPYWFAIDARDQLVNSYKLPRAVFYCPTNQGRNNDGNWYHTEFFTQVACIAGYTYYGGTPIWYNVTPSAAGAPIPFSQQLATQKPPTFPVRLGGKSTYDVVWANTVVSYGNFINLNQSCNHVLSGTTIVPGGYLSPGSGGWNNAYLDGHVESVPQNLVLRKWFWSDGVALYRGLFRAPPMISAE